MFKTITKTKQFLYLALLLVLTVTFSCNKDHWWDLFKKGGNGGGGNNTECINKSRINPNKFCPKVNEPVCGCDGKTYANACEADKNGVMKFTKGRCNPNGGGGTTECIDKSKINPGKDCPEILEPVCGCDGKTYDNACEADKNGVMKFTKGKCPGNGGGGTNDGCIDKLKIDPNKVCPKILEPVCGCDGKEYANACEADKNGVLKYVKGKCNPGGDDNGGSNTLCIDKLKIDPNKVCPKIDEPVCGCDGKDYANKCEADKNGVMKYAPGKCAR